MPFRRKYAPRRSAYRRPYAYRKYGKKYGRRRFTKKRFARNNTNQLTMRAPLASRLLRVKLPWVKTFAPNLAISGSQSYAFQGNGIVPYTAAGQTGSNTTVAAGDSLPAGEVEYSSFYDKYVINGSSIKVEAISINGQAQANSPLIRAVLIAVPFTATDNSPVQDTWQAVKIQLDTYSYEELLAWPYAKWRMIGSNAGGASRLIFKMFRKTKNMSGVKDLRDNLEYISNLTDGTAQAVGNVVNPTAGFMYYLRFFNANTTLTAPLEITVRMSLYVTMFSREFNPIQTVTA